MGMPLPSGSNNFVPTGSPVPIKPKDPKNPRLKGGPIQSAFVPEGGMAVNVQPAQDPGLGQVLDFASASRKPETNAAVPPPPRVPPVATGFVEPDPEENRRPEKASVVGVSAGAGQVPEKPDFERMIAQVQAEMAEKLKE